jgi:hypothetical protein
MPFVREVFWSLFDMLRVYAEHYIGIGKTLQLLANPTGGAFATNRPLTDTERTFVLQQFDAIKNHCAQLELHVSLNFLETYIGRFGTSLPAALDVKNCIDCFEVTFAAELGQRIFAFIPRHKTAAFDNQELFGSDVAKAFPSASKDIRQAGTSYALGLSTASVFHSMRVLESGLRVLAKEFSLSFQLEQWQVIIEQIESKIQNLKTLPKGMAKSEEQEFYSKAAKEFMYFKDAWRNHVMHGRGVYDEDEARKVLEHVDDFMRQLATKLKESNDQEKHGI